MDRAVPSDAYRYHTVRNDPEFPAGIFRQSSVIHSAVVFQAAVGDLRAISFYTAFHQVDPEKEILIRTLGGNRRDIFFKVVLPGSIPTLLSTTKVNIGLSLVGVIIGEFLAARRGLGYLIIYGSQVFQLDMVISSILLLCVIAMLLYLLTQSLEHYSKKHRN